MEVSVEEEGGILTATLADLTPAILLAVDDVVPSHMGWVQVVDVLGGGPLPV